MSQPTDPTSGLDSLLAAAFRHLTDAVFVFDASSVCQYSNSRGDGVRDWVLPMLQESVARVISAREASSLELSVGAAEDRKIYHCELTPIPDGVGGSMGVAAVLRDVTIDRAAQEAAERESEQRRVFFKRFLDHLPVAVFCKDSEDDYRYTIWNRKAEEFWGKSSGQVLGQTAFDWMEREDAAALLRREREVIVAGEKATASITEENAISSDGKSRKLSVRRIPVQDSGGRSRYLLGIAQEISHVESLDERIRDQQNSLQSIAETVPGAIYRFVLRPDGSRGFEYLSPGAERIFDARVEDILSGVISEKSFIHPEDEPVFQARLQNSIDTLEAFRWIGRIISAAGNIRWLQCHSNPQRQQNGELVWSGLMLDVTENKASEVELSAAIQRQYLHVQRTPLGVIEYDLEGKISAWNPAAEKIFGYFSDEVLGKHWSILVPQGLDYAELERTWSDQLKSEGGGRGSYLNVTKFGDFIHCEWYISLLMDPRGKVFGVASLVQDVTRQKEAELKIEAERARIIAASRFTLLGQMVGGVAQEINNPLSSIQSAASTLMTATQEGAVDAREVAALAAKISTSTHRITRIANSLKTLSINVELDPFQSIPITQILRYTLDVSRQQLRSGGVSLIIDPLGDHLSIECRPTQISLSLLHLLSNAHDAVSKVEDKWVRITTVDHGEMVEIRVADGGPGVPREMRDQLGKPFFSTKVGRGSGLGLSRVREVAHIHGGQFFLDIASDNTCFVLVFPKKQAATQPQVTARSA